MLIFANDDKKYKMGLINVDSGMMTTKQVLGKHERGLRLAGWRWISWMGSFYHEHSKDVTSVSEKKGQSRSFLNLQCF